jgi:DNA polymerase-3 subunit gamma/tau
VIIIDEAHMLSKSAFNALLKTLEEPPGHVTFIMATTEPEKFPQTIISRCQHYVFRRLSQAGLKEHLQFVTDREGVQAEESALNLLARRGAGSVRDSMSLLSQVLALGGDRLTDAAVREVLGLAGQEVFLNVVQAIHEQDILALNRVLEELLDTGLDIGFFLRELVQCWRNLFLLSQAGESAGDLMDLPAEEIAAWKDLSGKFSPAHIHAAWQMTLENQRRILTSLEPGPALEMLLLNLAFLPRLMPLSRVSGYDGPQGAGEEGRSDAASKGGQSRPAPATPPGTSQSDPVRPAPPRGEEPPPSPGPSAAPSPPAGTPLPSGPRDWSGFLRHYGRRLAREKRPLPGLKQAGGVLREGELIITCASPILAKGLMAQDKFSYLSELVREYFGAETGVRVEAVESAPRRTRADLKRDMLEHPVVKTATEEFHARIMDVRPVSPSGAEEDKDAG